MATITLDNIEAALGGRGPGGARRRIADQLDISEQAVGRWFTRGEIPPRRAAAIADLTGYNIDQIMRAEGYTGRTASASR